MYVLLFYFVFYLIKAFLSSGEVFDKSVFPSPWHLSRWKVLLFTFLVRLVRKTVQSLPNPEAQPALSLSQAATKWCGCWSRGACCRSSPPQALTAGRRGMAPVEPRWLSGSTEQEASCMLLWVCQESSVPYWLLNIQELSGAAGWGMHASPPLVFP